MVSMEYKAETDTYVASDETNIMGEKLNDSLKHLTIAVANLDRADQGVAGTIVWAFTLGKFGRYLTHESYRKCAEVNWQRARIPRLPLDQRPPPLLKPYVDNEGKEVKQAPDNERDMTVRYSFSLVDQAIVLMAPVDAWAAGGLRDLSVGLRKLEQVRLERHQEQ